MDKIPLGGDLRDQLLEDLMLVIQDAEDLLRSTGKQASESYQLARAKFESTLGNAKESLSELETRVSEGAREAYASTNRYVQENPWQAMGAGALAGLAIGLWLSRR
ncbi:MAG TPA: DUF883 family protein [Noviherbaspirillum sp.]